MHNKGTTATDIYLKKNDNVTTPNQIPWGKCVTFSVEDLVVDIYYWFDKRSKCENKLNAFCVFCDTTHKHVLRHASTR